MTSWDGPLGGPGGTNGKLPAKRKRVERRRSEHGRRAWDLPPNVTAVLVAWAVAGPALVAALVTVWITR